MCVDYIHRRLYLRAFLLCLGRSSSLQSPFELMVPFELLTTWPSSLTLIEVLLFFSVLQAILRFLPACVLMLLFVPSF